MYEDVECKICGRVGTNIIDTSPVEGHPNVEEKRLICKCGHDLGEVDGM